MYVRKNIHVKRHGLGFRPDFIAYSVQDINFDYLKKLGISTCFIDLDGTVVDRGSYEIDPQLTEYLKKSGLDIKIATNRPKSRTLKNLKHDLNATSVIHPKGLLGKPTKSYVLSALKDYNLKKEEVVMIGDRYIQDILGANRSGIYSLLVYKLGSSKGMIDKLISKTEREFTEKIIKEYKRAVIN